MVYTKLIARNMKVIVSTMYGNARRDVEVEIFVSMGNIKGFAGIVMVVRCTKPHTVLR